MRRPERSLLLAAMLCAAPLHAQDAAVAPAPGPVDPTAQLPAGHPPVAPAQPRAEDVHRAELPRPQNEESAEVPAGTVVVRVVDLQGNPVPEAPVRLGVMRAGEPGPALEGRAGPDGVARFDGLDAGEGIAYRPSTEAEGARFSGMPFQLAAGRGMRVLLVRYPVSRDPRGTLLWDARFELHFRDERLTVVERLRIVNLTAMALGDTRPEPRAYVPQDGIRFAIPHGHTAFQTAPMMSDARVTEEGDFAVVRGAIAPTTEAPLDVVFQYQLRLNGGDFGFDASLPLSVVTATVASEAPPGLTLTVDGFPAAQTREGNGDRVLVTGLERRPNDPPLEMLHVRLGGIPRAAGPMRTAATAAAAALVLGALGVALARGRRARAKRPLQELDAERDRVLAEAEELARLRDAGEVGPTHYAQRRRELSVWLAAVLKEREANTDAQSP
jgi:hypothetical protein